MQEFASNIITFLEKREEKLLSWGFHNVRYSEADILKYLYNEAPQELLDQWNVFKERGINFSSIIKELHRNHLIYRLPDAPDKYRTRMAEAVRLLANLRQMFKIGDWATGPRLVSDIKIHLRNRIYPRRDLPADNIWNTSLKGLCSSKTKKIIKDCYDALSCDKNGNTLKFTGFQQRSFEHIFKEYYSRNWSGCVICAGTGSGKTKSFYIPSFLRVVEEISINPHPFTKVIAIYPRNVLLADQLREALSESNKLRPVLLSHGHRPITFGALLGSTPRNSWFNPIPPGQKTPSWYWSQKADGHVIPYLSSPENSRCELIWKRADREKGQTSLYRIGERNPDVPDGVLKITREQLMNDPPDILFLSLEMLNREMGNPQWRKTFGIRQGVLAPRLVLLDEVHTYEGIAGAQAAWVLRRWKYWIHSGAKAKSAHFVGLSATLKQAPEHMGRICGINPYRIAEFSPMQGFGQDGEMQSEGQEYNIAIKGDPASGTALLSTSIQTAMLMARLLTPRNHVVLNPAPLIRPDLFYLKKVFGFTDNLDSLNRWFSNMRDAERQCLARLRNIPNPLPNQVILKRMRDEGQIWELPSEIGYNLTQSLDVSRCSSQDPGANSNSDLILATSSLEVGFDDPEVGVILHHKSPMSISSFIQRKGRAGRIRGSRPWTVLILSDYGRDRWAFQAAERLFDPEIDNISLPITNPYVLRVQMALFLVDWLGQEIDKADSPFSYLSKPSKWSKQTQLEAKKYLEDFLQQGAQWKRFFQNALRFYFYGRGGLAWDNETDQTTAINELNDILWQEPRPLLTQGIPSLLRKLEVDWKQAGPGVQNLEDNGCKRPMPQLIPNTTFDELDLNEARIELESYIGHDKDDELLPIPQFLKESCPGRVSKRFSTLANLTPPERGYWHEYSLQLHGGDNFIQIEKLYPECISLTSVCNIQINCPSKARLKHIPNDTVDSSTSEWQWQTIANMHNDTCGEFLPVYDGKPWNKVFSRITAHLHINGSWIVLLRYADRCSFEIRYKKNNNVRGVLALKNNESAVEAIGFQVNADGLRFEIDNNHLQHLPTITPKMLGQLRYEYLLHQLKSSSALQEHLNAFQAEWMAQISLAMLTATKIRKNIPFTEAQELLNRNRPESARRVLEVIFQIRGVNPIGNEEESKLQQEINDLWRNPHIISEIRQHEAVLWNDPPGPNFDQWLRQRYLATLAQALRIAASMVSEYVTEDDLIVDVISVNGGHEILLTEKCSGGLGQMESVARGIKNNPRFFLDALENALAICPHQSWANNLNAVMLCALKEYRIGSGTLIKAFSEVRNAQNINSLEQAKLSLITAMYDHGLNPHRKNVSAVSMKLLRPGSSSKTDILTYFLNESWRRHSRKIGLQIPVRTFAYLVCSYPPSRRRLNDLFVQANNEIPTSQQLYAIIQQLLFEGCYDSCPDCLNNPNYFNNFGKPIRSIALSWLAIEISTVEVTGQADNWSRKAREVLKKEGRVCLVSQIRSQDNLTRNLVPLFFEELNMETYRESVHISRIERTEGFIKITLCVRDFTNA